MNQNIKTEYNLLINSILKKMSPLNKWRKDFIIEVLWLFLAIKDRINFLQLGRYGNFGEQRYRQQFEQDFDFLNFNKELVCEKASRQLAIAFDPSYIAKSGKHTFGTGKYWSGCAKQAKWGLEISGIAAVDVDNHTAFHLEAVQTPDNKTLDTKSLNLLDWYAKIITDRVATLILLSKYVLVDAYFSKKPFIDKILHQGMHVISRFRDDANLRYLYKGEPTGKKGAPKKYAGKIDYKKLDLTYFEMIEQNSEHTLYSAIVNSKALKRNIKLVIMQTIDKQQKNTHKLFFSTDLEMDSKLIYQYYHERFQIEFLYRDGKNFTGLNDCQARDEQKLDFHFNTSLTSINIAKVCHWLSIEKEKRGAFSMSDVKTMNHNILLLERFMNVFAIDPNLINNPDIIKELIYFGKIAA